MAAFVNRTRPNLYLGWESEYQRSFSWKKAQQDQSNPAESKFPFSHGGNRDTYINQQGRTTPRPTRMEAAAEDVYEDRFKPRNAWAEEEVDVVGRDADRGEGTRGLESTHQREETKPQRRRNAYEDDQEDREDEEATISRHVKSNYAQGSYEPPTRKRTESGSRREKDMLSYGGGNTNPVNDELYMKSWNVTVPPEEVYAPMKAISKSCPLSHFLSKVYPSTHERLRRTREYEESLDRESSRPVYTKSEQEQQQIFNNYMNARRKATQAAGTYMTEYQREYLKWGLGHSFEKVPGGAKAAEEFDGRHGGRARETRQKDEERSARVSSARKPERDQPHYAYSSAPRGGYRPQSSEQGRIVRFGAEPPLSNY
ncbi:hypothetical protein HDV05_007100 [Chytridiales sp. JEL 0842]|nr:hypothetical protein HDV05_007100 [Chytridiales sp. JEL 0842]